MNRLGYSTVAINFARLWCSPTASEALSHGLNPGGACPKTPIEHCALYACVNKLCGLRAPHGHTNPTLCEPPPSSISASAPALHTILLMNSQGCISHDTLDLRSCTTFTTGTLWAFLDHPGCVSCTVGGSYQRDVVHYMYTNVQEEEIFWHAKCCLHSEKH